MRKLLKTKNRHIGFPGILYGAIKYTLIFSGIILIFTGCFLSQNFFLKFTINNKLTDDAVNKITKFKIFLATSGLIAFALALLVHFCKNNILKFITGKKVLLQKLILMLLTILAVLVIIEFAARILLPKDVKYNFPPGLDEFRGKYVSLNKQGYRDTEHAHNKDKNTVRIAVLGDSFTFGSGIKNVNDTYPKKLEKTLNSKSEKTGYEVLNFGKPGIDTEYEIKILKNDAIQYRPDIIIVGYVLNDFRDMGTAKTKKSSNIYLFWLDVYLHRYSYLYGFISKGFNIALEATGLRKSYYQTIIDEFNSENNKKFNRMYFEELKEISKNNNATLIIAVFPFIYKLHDYPFTESHNFVSRSGNEYGIIILDLLPYFENKDENELIVSRYDPHPNQLGHQIIADAIYEKLIKLKLAP